MKIFSFDIFDTCITRTCGTGKDVFYLLADKIIPNASETVKREFAQRRQEAEEEVIRTTNNSAPSIDLIYEHFNTSPYTDIDRDNIKIEEESIEESSWTPIIQTIDKIKECRSKGRVIFISDMYLPSNFLLPRLKKLGIINEGEELFVSCDFSKTKRSGDLFKLVGEKEKIKYKDWTHYGDDRNNDYLMPKKLGIQAKQICYPYSKYEQMWYNKGRLNSNHALQLYASITRSFRLKHYHSNNDEIIPNLSVSCFIPTALRFVSDIKKKNISHIFFASRDMYYSYIAAKILFSDDTNLNIDYFHISTKVLYPLLIKEGTADELLSIFKMVYSFKPSSMLKMFGIEQDAIDKLKSSVDINKIIISKSEEAKQFANLLLECVGKEWLRKTSSQKYQRFVEYAKQTGFLTEERPIALIDLGWRGTSQLVLHKLGITNVVYGYLGMLPSRIPATEMGDSFTYNYSEDKVDIDIYRIIVEYYLCVTNQGSTIDYSKHNGIIEPLCDKVNLNPEETKRCELTSEIVKEIATAVKLYWNVFKAL